MGVSISAYVNCTSTTSYEDKTSMSSIYYCWCLKYDISTARNIASSHYYIPVDTCALNPIFGESEFV